MQVWQGGEGWAMSDQLGILGWKKTQIQRFFIVKAVEILATQRHTKTKRSILFF